MPKKPASTKDWHRADVIAAVRKTGTTLRGLSRKHGLYHTAMNQALNKPAPKAERLIAEHLGLTPQDIWPSRYHDDGSPKSGRGERDLGRYKRKYKFNGSQKNSNVNPVDNRSAVL